jgi:hypothetical protein
LRRTITLRKRSTPASALPRTWGVSGERPTVAAEGRVLTVEELIPAPSLCGHRSSTSSCARTTSSLVAPGARLQVSTRRVCRVTQRRRSRSRRPVRSRMHPTLAERHACPGWRPGTVIILDYLHVYNYLREIIMDDDPIYHSDNARVTAASVQNVAARVQSSWRYEVTNAHARTFDRFLLVVVE